MRKIDVFNHIYPPAYHSRLMRVAPDYKDIGKRMRNIPMLADPGSWSAVGTDALIERYFPPYQPTMNFGWLKDDTDDQEYERVVVHEFGHVLGFRDGYLRGYRDLGERGFEILELTSAFDDIMSAPREGHVQAAHFKLMMENVP